MGLTSPTKTYNADQVKITFAGITAVEFGEDTFIEIERQSPAYTSKVGINGNVVREQQNDGRARIRVHLMATSPTNALWTGIHAVDRASKSGAGIAPLTVRDKNSDLELHVADEAWIAEEPQVSFSRGVEERVWIFECDTMSSFHGGH